MVTAALTTVLVNGPAFRTMTTEKPKLDLALVKNQTALFESEEFRSQIAKVLPSHITPDRQARIILTAFLKSPQIQQACTTAKGKASLMNACMVFSQAGLEPDGRLGHLIPYWSKEHNTYIIQAIFDWKGLVALGLRNGHKSIYPDVVHEHDDFDAYVENGVKKLLHRPRWGAARGEPKLVYCVTMSDKDVLDYEIMSIEETESIRKRSKAGESGPWVTDTLEMRKKCPIRRMSKRWDLLPEIRDAIYSDDDSLPELKVTAPQMNMPKSPTPEPGLLKVPVEPPTTIDVPVLLEELRKKAAKSNIGEGVLLEFIQGVCPVSDGCPTLEQAAVECLDNIVTINEQWPEIAKRIQAAMKGE